MPTEVAQHLRGQRCCPSSQRRAGNPKSLAKALFQVETSKSNAQARDPKKGGGVLREDFKSKCPSAGRKFNALAEAQTAAKKRMADGRK
eukprot:5308329-Pyramimonas_sp.AAC.1